MKVLLFALGLCLSLFSFSQIEKIDLPKYVSVGKWKMGGKTWSEMSYRLDEDKDTVYHWQYINQEYSSIVSYQYIDFNATGNTFETLYNILIDCFDKEKDYQTTFKLGSDIIFVIVQKMMGAKSLYISSPDKGYFVLSNKTVVNKLFGKNKD